MIQGVGHARARFEGHQPAAPDHADDRDDDELVLISTDASLLHFSASQVRPQRRTAGGMAGLRLADGEQLSPVQEAFRDCHALQCGFCTPGMIMQATDLLAENPDPDEEQVRQHMEGNLCRCTGYHNIVKAVLQAAGSGSATATQGSEQA